MYNSFLGRIHYNLRLLNKMHTYQELCYYESCKKHRASLPHFSSQWCNRPDYCIIFHIWSYFSSHNRVCMYHISRKRNMPCSLCSMGNHYIWCKDRYWSFSKENGLNHIQDTSLHYMDQVLCIQMQFY